MRTAETVKREILSLVDEYCRLEHGPADGFVPGDRIAYASRVFDEREVRNLVEASLEFWLTAGRWMRAFEDRLASFLGVRHVLFVNSGSSANLLAVAALTSPLLGDRRITPGDEVITVAAAFPTTVAPILQCRAVPVFVDVSIPSANIDVTPLDRALSSRTKAVILAHTLGNPFRVREVKAFCKTHGLWLIEDNCDALGSRYEDQYTGTFGDIGTSSFYPPHHITTGEGGALYTDDPQLLTILRSLRDWGRECQCESGQDNRCGQRFSGQFGTLPSGYDHKYVYSHLGFNLKATDLQAAIGCAQLEKLPDFIARRQENWQLLRDGLAGCSDVFHLPEAEQGASPSWFGFLLTVREGARFSRNELVRRLEEKNIQTRMLFAGNLIRHPCFQPLQEGRDYRVVGALSATDAIMNRSCWIGVYPGLNQQKIDFMIDTIINAACAANRGNS